MRIVRFTDTLLTDDVLTVHSENVPVKVFGVATVIRPYLEALTANA